MNTAKFWVALIGAVLVAVIPVLPPGTDDLKQWLTVAVSACTAIGVYLVPNAAKGRHAATEAGPAEVYQVDGVTGISANGTIITGNERPPEGLK